MSLLQLLVVAASTGNGIRSSEFYELSTWFETVTYVDAERYLAG